MIPNQWYPIVTSDQLKPGKPLGVRRCGEDLVLWRDSHGRAVAQVDRCPHKGSRLSLGNVIGDTIECPYHGFRYNGEGTCTLAPALGADGRIPASIQVRSRVVREAEGLIWLWWGETRSELPPLPLVPELSEGNRLHSTVTWSRPVHYTRYIESLLEFYHITFVHRGHWFNYVDYLFLYGTWKKLGLDGKRRYLGATKIANYVCNVDGTTLRSSFDLVNEKDPSFPGERYEITFAFPNLVYVKTTQFRAAAWLTPIDQDHTEMILRWYEFDALKPFLRIPPMRKALPYAACYMEKWIQDIQDNRVMQSQRPKISTPGASRFIAYDEMNSRYLAIRAQLIREAQSRKGSSVVPLHDTDTEVEAAS